MPEPRSYVIRIYRMGFRSLSGVLEDPRTGGQYAFRSSRELLALLRRTGEVGPYRRARQA